MDLTVTGGVLYANNSTYTSQGNSGASADPENSVAWDNTNKRLTWVDGGVLYYAESESIGATSDTARSMWGEVKNGYDRLYVSDGTNDYHVLPWPLQEADMYTDIDTESDPYNPTTLTYPIASSLVNADASTNAIIHKIDFVVQVPSGGGTVLNVSVKKNTTEVYTINVGGTTGTFTQDFGLQSTGAILLTSSDTLNFDISFETKYQVYARLYWVNPPSTYTDSRVIY